MPCIPHVDPDTGQVAAAAHDHPPWQHCPLELAVAAPDLGLTTGIPADPDELVLATRPAPAVTD